MNAYGTAEQYNLVFNTDLFGFRQRGRFLSISHPQTEVT